MARRNVLGTELASCSTEPMTGFARDGCCGAHPQDPSAHVVCAQVTEAFLAYTKSRGNDLSAPAPGFPGLKPGDRWCLCASRWREAFEIGAAPRVALLGTDEAALEYVELDALKSHAIDLN